MYDVPLLALAIPVILSWSTLFPPPLSICAFYIRTRMYVVKVVLISDITQPISRLIDQHARTRSSHEVAVPMDVL